MRITVAGATGNIGARTASILEREGHEVICISRSLGVDVTTGECLDAALKGVDAVVDAISSPPVSPDETREYLGTTIRNLLAAEERAGVGHHVLLTIVGIHRIKGGYCPLLVQARTRAPDRGGPGAVDDCASHPISRLCDVGC